MAGPKEKLTTNQENSTPPALQTQCNHSIMNGLTQEELDFICAKSTKLNVKKKELVFRQGSIPAGIYYVVSGKVKISHTDSSGKETILDIICPGGLAGFSPLFLPERYQLSATTLEDSELLFVEKAPFLELLDRSPQLGRNVQSQLATDVRERTKLLFNHLQKNVRERVADALLTYHERCSAPLAMRREDLAGWAATSMESAVRVLSDFKREGVIRTAGREIFILKPEELGRIAGRR